MPAKKKTTSKKKSVSNYKKPSLSKQLLFVNIGLASLAVIGFMGYTVFHGIGTADAATTTTLGR